MFKFGICSRNQVLQEVLVKMSRKKLQLKPEKNTSFGTVFLTTSSLVVHFSSQKQYVPSTSSSLPFRAK